MRVHHIAITVKDLDVSTAFYKKYFGFNEVKRFTKPEWAGSAISLRLEDFQLELFTFKRMAARKDDLSDITALGIKHISIQVDDVRKKRKEIFATWKDIDAPIKGTTCAWFCFLRDPDGIPIELYEQL